MGRLIGRIGNNGNDIISYFDNPPIDCNPINMFVIVDTTNLYLVYSQNRNGIDMMR